MKIKLLLLFGIIFIFMGCARSVEVVKGEKAQVNWWFITPTLKMLGCIQKKFLEKMGLK